MKSQKCAKIGCVWISRTAIYKRWLNWKFLMISSCNIYAFSINDVLVLAIYNLILCVFFVTSLLRIIWIVQYLLLKYTLEAQQPLLRWNIFDCRSNIELKGELSLLFSAQMEIYFISFEKALTVRVYKQCTAKAILIYMYQITFHYQPAYHTLHTHKHYNDIVL